MTIAISLPKMNVIVVGMRADMYYAIHVQIQIVKLRNLEFHDLVTIKGIDGKVVKVPAVP